MEQPSSSVLSMSSASSLPPSKQVHCKFLDGTILSVPIEDGSSFTVADLTTLLKSFFPSFSSTSSSLPRVLLMGRPLAPQDPLLPLRGLVVHLYWGPSPPGLSCFPSSRRDLMRACGLPVDSPLHSALHVASNNIAHGDGEGRWMSLIQRCQPWDATIQQNVQMPNAVWKWIARSIAGDVMLDVVMCNDDDGPNVVTIDRVWKSVRSSICTLPPSSLLTVPSNAQLALERLRSELLASPNAQWKDVLHLLKPLLQMAHLLYPYELPKWLKRKQQQQQQQQQQEQQHDVRISSPDSIESPPLSPPSSPDVDKKDDVDDPPSIDDDDDDDVSPPSSDVEQEYESMIRQLDETGTLIPEEWRQEFGRDLHSIRNDRQHQEPYSEEYLSGVRPSRLVMYKKPTQK